MTPLLVNARAISNYYLPGRYSLLVNVHTGHCLVCADPPPDKPMTFWREIACGTFAAVSAVRLHYEAPQPTQRFYIHSGRDYDET